MTRQWLSSPVAAVATFLCSRIPRKRRMPPPRPWILCSLKYACLSVEPTGEAALGGRTTTSLVYSSLTVTPSGEAVVITSEQKVYDVMLKQASLLKRQLHPATMSAILSGGVRTSELEMPLNGLKEAYDCCGEICEEYAKTFYLGTLLMTEERQRAIWAIYE